MIKILRHFRRFDTAVGKSHRRGTAMKTVHPHQSETCCGIGNRLWITPDSRHHVEKRLDIVADGLESFDIGCGQRAVIRPMVWRARRGLKIDDLTPFVPPAWN